MLIGYMRVFISEIRQSTDLQHDALTAAGVEARNVHDDVASWAKVDRTGLMRSRETLTAGDVRDMWKPDRLGDSRPHLLALLEELRFRAPTTGAWR